MRLDILILILSPLSVFLFLGLEHFYAGPQASIGRRIWLASSMELLSKSLGILISIALFLKFVNLVSPLEILSVSNIDIPRPINFLLSLFLVDLFHYISHRFHHVIPLLWKVHRLHHSDRNIDSLTSFIHHPFEVATIFFCNVALYVLFDIPVIAILWHSILMVMHSPFSHTRLNFPAKVESFLSYFIITPNFHRLHHSLDIKEGNSNFGTLFPYWDRIFGTGVFKKYLQMKKIKFGISSIQKPKKQNIKEYLVNPFVGKTS